MLAVGILSFSPISCFLKSLSECTKYNRKKQNEKKNEYFYFGLCQYIGVCLVHMYIVHTVNTLYTHTFASVVIFFGKVIIKIITFYETIARNIKTDDRWHVIRCSI